MAKVVTIIEDNSITGVRYGTVEVPQTPVDIKRAYKQAERIKTQQKRKIRSERTKNK